MKIVNGTVYSKGYSTLNFGYYDPRTRAPYISVLGASQYLISHLSSIPIGFTICVNEDNKPVEYWWDGIAFILKVNGITSEELQQAINNIPQSESISIKNFTVYYLGNNPPLASTIEATYSFSTDILIIETSGITQIKPEGSNIYYYKGTILSNSNSITWEGPFREITDLELINQMSISSTYPLQIYKVASTQPEIPTGITFTYSNGVVTYTQLNGWSETIPQTTGGKVYVSYNNLILTQDTSLNTPVYNGNCTGWTTPVEYIDLDVILGDVINTNNTLYKLQREQAISDLEDWLGRLSTNIGNAQNTLDEISAIQQQIDGGQLDLTGILSNLNNISELLVTNGWALYKIYYVKYNNQYVCYLNDAFLTSESTTNAVLIEAAEIITGGYYIKRIYQGNSEFVIEDCVQLNPVSNTFKFESFVEVTLEEFQSGSFLYSKQVLDALNGEFLTQAAAINPTGAFKTAIQTISAEKIRNELTSISGQTIKQAVQTIADGEITNTVGELTNDLKVNLSKFLQSPNGITLEALGGETTVNITNWKLSGGPISYLSLLHLSYIESNLRQGYTIINNNVIHFKPVPYILNNLLLFGQFIYLVLDDGVGTNLYMYIDSNGNLTTDLLNNDFGRLIIGTGIYSANKNSVTSAMMNIVKNRICLSVTSPSNSASFTIGIDDYNGNSYTNIAADTISLTGQVLANAIATESLNVNDSTYLLSDGSAAFGKYKTYFDLSGDGYLAEGKISWGSRRLYVYSNSNKTTLLLTFSISDLTNLNTVTLNINETQKTFKLYKFGTRWGLRNVDDFSEYAYYNDTSKKWLTSTQTWLNTIYYDGAGLSVEGLIVATGGQIGGWTISSNALVTNYNNYNFTIYPGDTNSMGYMRVTNNDTPLWLLNADGTASFSQGAITFGTNSWVIGTPSNANANANAQISYSNGQITIGSDVVIAGDITAKRINISKVVNNNTISDYAGMEGPTANNNKVIWSGDTRSGNPSFYVTDEGEIFGSKGILSVINNNHVTDLSNKRINECSEFISIGAYDGFLNVYVLNPHLVGDIVYLPKINTNTNGWTDYYIVLPYSYVTDPYVNGETLHQSVPNLIECVGRKIILISPNDSETRACLIGSQSDPIIPPSIYYSLITDAGLDNFVDSNTYTKRPNRIGGAGVSDNSIQLSNYALDGSNPSYSSGMAIVEILLNSYNGYLRIFSTVKTVGSWANNYLDILLVDTLSNT